MTTPTPKNTAFLGLGAMGYGMATSLLTTLPHHRITGYDIWAPSLARFVTAGGLSATTPLETVRDADFVVFMVATAAQILSALFTPETGALGALKQGAVVILSSTGPPEHSIIVKERLVAEGRADIKVVDAPVSGGTIRAANGTLTILASGEDEDVAAAREVLDAMAGNNLYLVPGGLGAGTKVKMVHQVLAGIHILMASEGMGFAAALGLETRNAFDEIMGGEAASWMLGNRGPHMLEDQKGRVFSALNIIVKDVGIITSAARKNPFPLFLTTTTSQVLTQGVLLGYGPIDDAQLLKVYLPASPDLVLQLASSPDTATKSTGTSEEEAAKLKLVTKAMSAVHLVSTMEAMSLGAKVGLDTKQLYEIISGAAGSSWMFVDRTPQLLSGEWKKDAKRTVDGIIADLTEAIEEATKLGYPLHLGGTALQILQLASLRGFGAESDVAVSRVWDSVDGPLFPQPQKV